MGNSQTAYKRSAIDFAFASLALALTLALFLFGGRKVSASIFGTWHDTVHVATFGILLLVYGLALRWVHCAYLVLGIVALGALHELSQLAFGGRTFELEDFLCNAVGAVLGGCLHFLLNKQRKRAFTINPRKGWRAPPPN